jgi:hypothetical protein
MQVPPYNDLYLLIANWYEQSCKVKSPESPEPPGPPGAA